MVVHDIYPVIDINYAAAAEKIVSLFSLSSCPLRNGWHVLITFLKYWTSRYDRDRREEFATGRPTQVRITRILWGRARILFIQGGTLFLVGVSLSIVEGL